jgi:hypothetical protein
MDAAVIAVIIITIIALGLIPFGLPVIMPSWRWLLACTIIVGGSLAAFWIQDFVARQSPDYTESPGGGFGVGLALIVTIAFSAGLIARIARMVMSAYGFSLKSIITANVMCFLLFVLACSPPFALFAR